MTERHGVLISLEGALSRYSVFYVDFLRSKMAASRLEAVMPTNESHAFAAMFFFLFSPVRSFVIDRRRSISLLPFYSHIPLSWTKLGFEI